MALVFTEFTQIFQRGHRVPKVIATCQNCGKSFQRYASAYRFAKSRGTAVKFCSRACVGAARSAGTIEAKKKRGDTFSCEVCGTAFYRKASMIKKGKHRFCSEPCRLRAHELRLVDRTQPRPQNLRGEMITCLICGKSVYRKKSMIIRNVKKTCGDPVCMSAYGRSLWGLAPRDREKFLLPKPKRKVRATNFSSMQRSRWIGTECARCGTTENLTLDHIVPVCYGGKSVKSNAQTLCGSCNNWKAMNVDRLLARQQALSGG